MGEKFVRSAMILFGTLMIAGILWLWHIGPPTSAQAPTAVVVTGITVIIGGGFTVFGIKGFE